MACTEDLGQINALFYSEAGINKAAMLGIDVHNCHMDI